MRMLFLITILGFLFIMANKSPDESIGEATNVIINKSEKLFSRYTENLPELRTPEPYRKPAAGLSNLEYLKKHRKNRPSPIKQDQPNVQNVTKNENILDTNKKWEATKGYAPPAKNLNSPSKINPSNYIPNKQDVFDKDITPIRRDLNIVKPPVVTDSLGPPSALNPSKKTPELAVTKPLPPLPKAQIVSVRSIPKMRSVTPAPNPELLKELKRAERKYYDDASRILMSIK